MSRSISNLFIAAAGVAALLTIAPASAQNLPAQGQSPAGAQAPADKPSMPQKTQDQNKGTGPSNMGYDLKSSKKI